MLNVGAMKISVSKIVYYLYVALHLFQNKVGNEGVFRGKKKKSWATKILIKFPMKKNSLKLLCLHSLSLSLSPPHTEYI